MRIDLHTHSTASDGTVRPAILVERAASAGLDVVAITDHDTTHGWAEAAAAAPRAGVALVRGIEISTRHAGQGAHLLGYLLDPVYPPLVTALAAIISGRNSRVPAILDRLRDAGIGIDIDDVHRVAPDTRAFGRPHIADALVELGVANDRDDAFAKWLAPGRPAYLERYAAELTDMIGLVVGSGGVAVLAHPWARHDPAALREEGLAGLMEIGLAGLEVDHQDHPPEMRDELRAVAGNLGLIVTGASDYHGTGKNDHELGCNLTAEDQYAALLARAEQARAAAGRAAPGVVVP